MLNSSMLKNLHVHFNVCRKNCTVKNVQVEPLIDTKGIRDAGQKILVDEQGLPVGEYNKKLVMQKKKKMKKKPCYCRQIPSEYVFPGKRFRFGKEDPNDVHCSSQVNEIQGFLYV